MRCPIQGPPYLLLASLRSTYCYSCKTHSLTRFILFSFSLFMFLLPLSNEPRPQHRKKSSVHDHDHDETYSLYSDEEEDMEDYKRGGYHYISVGDVFHEGRYVTLRKLGWGHFSTVWLARDTV